MASALVLNEIDDAVLEDSLNVIIRTSSRRQNEIALAHGETEEWDIRIDRSSAIFPGVPKYHRHVVRGTLASPVVALKLTIDEFSGARDRFRNWLARQIDWICD